MTKPVREHKPKSYPGTTKDVDAIVGNSFNFKLVFIPQLTFIFQFILIRNVSQVAALDASVT